MSPTKPPSDRPGASGEAVHGSTSTKRATYAVHVSSSVWLQVDETGALRVVCEDDYYSGDIDPAAAERLACAIIQALERAK